MAKMVLPRVHGMVQCDEIEPSATEEDVFNLRGVRTRIVASSFPYTHPLFFVQESFRLNDCEFQEPGIYYIQVIFNAKLVGDRGLHILRGEAVVSNGQQTR